MAEQRSFVHSMARADVLDPAMREAEPSVKGEPAECKDRETGRALSEPSSWSIDPPGLRGSTSPARKSTRAQPPKDVAAYRVFRRLCESILEELGKIDAFFTAEEVSEEGVEVVAEVEAILEELYDCPYGQGESLKRLVVAVQSQVNNAQWDKRHVAFLREVFRFLRVRYLVDETSVKTCYDYMKARGLESFRGTICEPQARKHYRIEEVAADDGTGPKTP